MLLFVFITVNMKSPDSSLSYLNRSWLENIFLKLNLWNFLFFIPILENCSIKIFQFTYWTWLLREEKAIDLEGEDDDFRVDKRQPRRPREEGTDRPRQRRPPWQRCLLRRCSRRIWYPFCYFKKKFELFFCPFLFALRIVDSWLNSTDFVRDIRDPEHPYSLEQLSVLSEESITVDEKLGRIQ